MDSWMDTPQGNLKKTRNKVCVTTEGSDTNFIPSLSSG
jgi:hypothetical protein